MSPDLNRPLPLLGGYAMAPADPAESAAFYAALGELPLGGLEMPAPATDDAIDARCRQPDAPAGLGRDARLIPVVMGHRVADPARGLASDDDEARGRALADVARAVELARRVADEDGTGRVTAIEVHSAPGPEQGSISSLARSLATIADWDLAGAQIVLEHCDALGPAQTPSKGFLTLADEIAAIHAAGDPEAVGIGINWGRSAIEGRSASTPVEHVRMAREAHLLRAVVLSGATGSTTAWERAGPMRTSPRGARTVHSSPRSPRSSDRRRSRRHSEPRAPTRCLP